MERGPGDHGSLDWDTEVRERGGGFVEMISGLCGAPVVRNKLVIVWFRQCPAYCSTYLSDPILLPTSENLSIKQTLWSLYASILSCCFLILSQTNTDGSAYLKSQFTSLLVTPHLPPNALSQLLSLLPDWTMLNKLNDGVQERLNGFLLKLEWPFCSWAHICLHSLLQWRPGGLDERLVKLRLWRSDCRSRPSLTCCSLLLF